MGYKFFIFVLLFSLPGYSEVVITDDLCGKYSLRSNSVGEIVLAKEIKDKQCNLKIYCLEAKPSIVKVNLKCGEKLEYYSPSLPRISLAAPIVHSLNFQNGKLLLAVIDPIAESNKLGGRLVEGILTSHESKTLKSSSSGFFGYESNSVLYFYTKESCTNKSSKFKLIEGCFKKVKHTNL